MGWLGILLLIVMFFWVARLLKSSNSKRAGASRRVTVTLASTGRSSSPKAGNFKQSLQSLAPELRSDVIGLTDEVDTARKLKALENRLAKAQERVAEGGFKGVKGRQAAERKVRVLEAAVAIARDKRYEWHFQPELELITPLEVLERAYKMFTDDEYEAFKKAHPRIEVYWEPYSYYQGQWQNLNRKSDHLSQPPSSLGGLMLFRKIVESDSTQSEKIEQINKLAGTNPLISGLFDSGEGEPSPGDQWFIQVISDDGLPNAWELYPEGYTSPEKCLEIDLNAFLARKGVGPKTQEQLKRYQAKVKARLSKANAISAASGSLGSVRR